MANQKDVDRLNSGGVGLAAVIHELRNVISQAVAASQVLKNTLDDPDMFRDVANDICTSIDRLAFTFSGVTGISSGKKIQLKKESLSVIERDLSFINYPNREIRVNFTKNLFVNTHLSALHIVLANLIKNSFNASEKAVVTISSEISGDKVLIIVEDDGEGMTPDQVKKVFGNFSTNEHDIEIHGLGMQIVREACTNIGAEISCRSELGKGTDFIISLPLAT